MAAVDDQGLFDGDDELDPRGPPIAAHERIELNDVLGLLQSRLAILTGGRDKNGAWLITFPGHPGGRRTGDLTFDDLKKLLVFLVQVASFEDKRPTFSALIDARNETWQFCKFVVRGLQHFLGERMQAAYILEPTGFWSKRRSNTILKKEKGQLQFEIILLSAPVKLGRYIEMSQLNEDLGGFLKYNHSHWIEIRKSFDQFMTGVQQLFKKMDDKHKDLSSRQFGATVVEAEEMLDLHREEHGEIVKLPVNVQIEGQSLLERIVGRPGGLRGSGVETEGVEAASRGGVIQPALSLGNVMLKVQNQLEKVKGKRDLLEEVWELRLIQLEQCLHFRDFEHDINEAIGWFHGRGDTFLAEKTPVGTSREEAEGYMMQHIGFEAEANQFFDRLTKLQQRGDVLLEENQFAVAEINSKLGQADDVFLVFKKRIALRGQRLALSAKFHSIAEEIETRLDELMDGCDDDVIAYDAEAAEHLLGRFKLGLEEVDDMLDHMHGIGEGLMDLLQSQEMSEGSMQRRHFGDLFRQTTKHFMSVTGQLVDKRDQCRAMVKGKQNKLELFLQLGSCEQDTDKIIDWLLKASDLVLASQSDIGNCEQAARDLQQEHGDFVSKASATHESGLQLIDTAQILRERCALPTEPCIERHQRLENAWTNVAAAMAERTSRLDMSTVFYHDDVALNDRLGKIVDELRRQERVANVQAVEQLMVRYQRVRDAAKTLYDETNRRGLELLDRIEDGGGDGGDGGDDAVEVVAVRALISTRIDALAEHWGEVEREWALKMKQLEQLMGVKDFEDEVQQVLLWIEKETTGNLAARSSVGHSLASSTELLRETETFQHEAAAIHEKVERLTAQARQEISRGSLCRDQFEAGAVKLDLQWKQFSVRLLHWKSLLTMAVSFFEKADEFNQFLVKGVESFRSVALESTVEGMEKLLAEHGKRTATLKDMTKSTMNEGSALLDRLKHPGKELQFGDGDGETIRVNYDPSVGFLGSFLTELQDRSEQLDDMWTARGRALQQALELRKFEGNYRDVSVSVEAVAASMETSALEIGPSVAALMLLQEQHDSLEADAKAVVTKMARLGEIGEALVKAGHYAAADIRRSVRSVAPKVRRLAAAVLERRKVLSKTSEFQKKSKQLILVMDEIQKGMVDTGTLSSKDSCASARAGHAPVIQEIDKCASVLDEESRAYLQFVVTVPRTDSKKIQAFVKKVGEKIGQLRLIWQEKLKRLDFLMEGFGYREKVQETTEWISQKAWEFFSSHRNMGQNLATAQEALQVYESFEENSKSIHTQVIALYQQADKLLSSGQRGADIYKSESDRLISEWQHFLNHLDKSSQLLILYVSFYNAARQFGLLLNEFEAYIEDLNEQVLHHQSTRDTDAQLAECNRQMQKLASQTDARLKAFAEATAQYLAQVSRRWPVLDTQPASVVASKVAKDLQERQQQLEAIWELRKGSVEQEAEIQQFQQQTQKLVAWLHARTDAYFQQYGPGLPVDSSQAKERQEQLAKFQRETDENVKQIRHLLTEGERLIQDDHPVQSQYEQLRNAMEQFRRRTTQHKAMLEIAHTFHQVKEDLSLQLKRLRDDVTATRLPEDATEAAAEKRSLEERWLKISSYMDRLSTLAVDIKQHGRRQKQKNPAASLDHLKSQCQACERLVKARLERLGRSLVSSEFLAAARKAWTVLRRKMDEYFGQSARLGESRAVVEEQERQLIHFEDDIMVLRRRMGELIDEGRRKALSERSAGSTSVVAEQVESMEEVEQQLIAQITERREQHQLYLLFHSHADEVRKLCRDATLRFKEAHNRGLSATSSLNDVEAASDQLHALFDRMDAAQRDHLKTLDSLVYQIDDDDPTTIVDDLRSQTADVMDRYSAISSQLDGRERELRRKRKTSSTAGRFVMESEEDSSDAVFVTRERATYHEAGAVVAASKKRKKSSGPPKSLMSSLVAASIGAFGLSESGDSSAFYDDDSPNEMQDEMRLAAAATAVPSPALKRPSAAASMLKRRLSGTLEVEADDVAVVVSTPEDVETMLGVSASKEEDDDEEEETDAGEDAKEMRKAMKKIDYVLGELIKTEVDYVAKLRTVVKGILPRMDSHRVPTILENKKDQIFANIEEIYNFHKVFVKDLEQYQHQPQQACMCFIREEKNFWIYFPYCKNKSQSQKVLDEYGGNFFDDTRKELGLPLSLGSYLLEPVQRMMRYQMLLKELVKYAERARLDCASDLQAAVNAMLRVPKAANDALHLNLLEGFREKIDERKLLSQEPFLVWPSKPGDKLKKKGQEMHVFLHEDMVIFCRREGDSKVEKNAKEALRYVFKNRLLTSAMGLVENYRQSPHHAPDKMKFALTFGQSTVNTQQFVLQPVGSDSRKPEEVKRFWVDEIRALLQRQLEAARALQIQNLGDRKRTFHPLKKNDETKKEVSPLARPMSKTFSLSSLSGSESSEATRDFDIQAPSVEQIPEHTMAGPTDYIAVRDYVARTESEVSVQVGQRVEVIDAESQRGWALVCTEPTETSGQMEGYIPIEYIQPESTASFTQLPPPPRLSSLSQWPASMKKSSTIGSVYSGRTHSVMTRQSAVSSLQRVSNATASSTSTVRAPSAGVPSVGRASNASASSSTSSSRGLLDEECVVRQDFVAEDESMVSVKKGQIVVVLDASVKDWRLVRVPETETSDAKEGYIPLSCLLKQQAPPPPPPMTPPVPATIEDEEPAPPPPVRSRSSSSVMSRTSSQAADLPELVFVAQADFEATDESHVDLKLGQHVEVIDKTSVEGWWMVRTLEEDLSEEGFVPARLLAKRLIRAQRESRTGSVRTSSSSSSVRTSSRASGREIHNETALVQRVDELTSVREDEDVEEEEEEARAGVPTVVPPPPPLPDYMKMEKKAESEKKVVEKKVLTAKDQLKLSFQSELANVLKRKLKSPSVDRSTLYKSQFLQSDPVHEEITEEHIEELPANGVYYYAFASYRPTDDTQLPLFEGQKLEIIDSKLSDWWLARIPNPATGQAIEGWVPTNYLQDIESYESEHEVPQPDPEPSPTSPPAAVGEEKPTSGLYRAIADFSALHEGTVPLISGDLVRVIDRKDGWWLVSSVSEDGSGPEGWAPATYLEPEDGEDEADSGFDYAKEARLAANFLKKILGGDNWDLSGSGSSLDEDEDDEEEEEDDDDEDEESKRTTMASTGRSNGAVSVGVTDPPQPETLPPVVSGVVQPTFVSTHGDMMSPVTAMDHVQDALLKRSYVMEELIDTEKEYVETMEYAIRHYYTKMDDANVPAILVGKKDVIFANMPEILEFHKNTFCSNLVACGDDAQAMGRCFVDYEERLQALYVAYCQNKPKSDAVLQDPSKSFFDDIQSELKDKANISGYLMKPVWRITKYQLLLKDLVKYTKRASQDVRALETALEECLEIPRKANNALAFAMLESPAKFDKSIVGDLLLQDAFLVSKSRGAERRQVFLFERLLVFAKIKRESGSLLNPTSHEKVTYQEKTRLNMEQVMLTVNVDNDPCKFMLSAGGKSSTKYFLKAQKPAIRNAWVEEIQNLLTSQLLRIKSKSSRLTRQASPCDMRIGENSDSASSSTTTTTSSLMAPETAHKSKRGKNLSRSSMKNIQMKENLRWIGAFDAVDGGPGLVAKGGKRPSFQKDKEGRSKISIELVKSDTRTLITVGETYVIRDDVTTDEILLTANEHVSVLSSDGKGNYLVESKDGELGWISGQCLRDERDVVEATRDSPKLIGGGDDVVVRCTKGQTAHLRFALVANPPASVKWYRDSVELPSDDGGGARYFYRADAVDGEAVLDVLRAVRDDTGTYKCVATNELGLDSDTISLEVQDAPDPPSRVWATNVFAKSAQVNWIAPDHDGGSPVLHYTLEKLAVDGSAAVVGWVEVSSCCRDAQKTVFQLDEGTGYQFRVFSMNAIGKSAPSRPSEVVTTRKKHGSFDRDRSGSPYKGQIVDIKNEDVSKYYEVKEEIATGKYGPILRCVHRRSGLSCAAKVMKFRPGQLDIGRHEVDMLNGLRHPNIVYLKDALLTQRTLTIVTEMADGGTLFDNIPEFEIFTEADASRYVKQIVSACSYLHDFGLVHLDLKPENILLERHDSDIVKIIDFSKAQRLKADKDIRIVYGNPEFVAPEVLSCEPVSETTDMWSIGVLTYVMLSGISPFHTNESQSIYLNIESAAYTFAYDCFDKISTEAKQFIKQLLIADRRFRLKVDACLNSAWLQSRAPRTRLDTKELRNFVSRRREQAVPSTPRTRIGFESSQRRASYEDETPPGFSILLQNVRVPIGRTASFTVSVFGYPEPIVRWYKNDEPIDVNSDDSRAKIRSGGDLYSFVIVNVERRDAGTYSCSASNSFGSSTTSAKLQIDDNPAAPYRPSANQLEATSALVCWEAPASEPTNVVESYVVERRRADHDTWEVAASGVTSCSYIADGLLPGHGYQFRVVAVSRTGRSQPSECTGVVTLEEQTGEAAAEIQLRNGNPDDAYDILEEIGRGRYGVVMKCREKSTDWVYAAKFIPMDRKRSEDAWRELEVMQMACHPRLASLHEAFDSSTHLVLISEYVEGGRLFDHLAGLETCTEDDVMGYMRQVLEGLDYLHQRNIVYLNLLPETILLGGSRKEIKLIDFGRAKVLTGWTVVNRTAASMDFMAPEALTSQRVSGGTDIWSVGAVVITLLTGTPPFAENTDEETIERTRKLEYTRGNVFASLSPEAAEFVRELLTLDQNDRPMACDCTKLPWMKATAAQSAKRRKVIVPTTDLQAYIRQRNSKLSRAI